MDRIVARSEREAIDQLRAIYEPKGYDIVLRPGPDQLPDFVGNFRPDAVLRGAENNIVVEIKTLPGTDAKNAQVAALAKAVESRQDWELLLILLRSESAGWEARYLPDRAGISAMLDAASSKRPNDSEQARFLQAWLLFEAAARQVAFGLEGDRHRGPVPTAAVIEKLVSHGLLEDDEARHLEDFAAIRNALAHGFLVHDVPAGAIELLLETARRLVALEEAA